MTANRSDHSQLESTHNAQYHAAHARRARENRWPLAGYATHGVLGGLLGLTLVLVRRRQGAG